MDRHGLPRRHRIPGGRRDERGAGGLGLTISPTERRARPTVERWHGREDALQVAIAEDRAAFAEPPPGKTPYLFSEATGFVREEETAAIFMARICAEAAAHLRAAAARAD